MFTHTKPRYSINDMLALLSIGRAGLYAAIHEGKLETYKIGKRRFASPEAVDRFVENCEQEAARCMKAGQSLIDHANALEEWNDTRQESHS